MKGCGTYTWFGYIADFSERLRLIRQAGFDTVFTFWDRVMGEADAPLEEHTALAEKNGLTVEHSHLPYYGCNVLWRDCADADSLMKIYEDGIVTAGKCGPKTLVIHPCEVFAPSDGSFGVMAEHMRALVELASENGVRLAFENLGENDTVRRLLKLFENEPFAGLCFDSGHNNLASPDDFSLLEEFSGRVFALHIHDNDGKKDRHLLPFAEGCTVDWKKAHAALCSSGFEGSLMLEACYPVDYDSLEGNEMYYVNPDYPMESWLKDAHDACERICSQN
ncbi:MAG: sugar phosphate isomerase/epimerase [Eubacteriaceae bacterium]|nr:sugar phosphate isomerase/epimerase [Eubacteriaceae bacterium]